MTESAKEAWSEVGEKFGSWGRRVADRYNEAGTADTTAEESQRELHREARELVEEISRGFSALRKTVRDDEANKELSDALDALGDAITATVTEAGQSLRSGGSRSKG
jgi:DNA-binding ferritin-like protein